MKQQNIAAAIEPAFLTEARRYIGVTEIPGAKHNPIILGFWKAAKLAGIKTDEVPWCGGFVCACLENVGIRSPRSDSSRAFLSWGKGVAAPFVGAIVVFSRDGGGHVGIVVGKDQRGNLMVLGGNQGNAVNIKPFAAARVTGYRAPSDWQVPQENFQLPLLNSDGVLSQNEA